jgi:hypothetical protein
VANPVDRDLADARERLAALEVEVRTLTQLAEGVKFAAAHAPASPPCETVRRRAFPGFRETTRVAT